MSRGFETSYGHLTGGIGYFDHTAAGRLDGIEMKNHWRKRAMQLN